MTKFSHLANKPAAKNSRGKKVIPVVKVNIKVVNTLLVVLLFVMGLSYLVQINSLATKGYQIKELEKQVADLQQVKSDLELEALSLQSMGSIKDKVSGLNMVSAGETDYLDTNSAVAVR